MSAYTSAKPIKIAVHRILGWSLRCPLSLQGQRWANNFDVDHDNVDHNDNTLANLFCKQATGKGGHRSVSGLLGARERWRRQREREAAEEQEGEEEEDEVAPEDL